METPMNADKTENKISSGGLFVNGVYRPSEPSNRITSFQPTKGPLKNRFDTRTSTSVPVSSSTQNSVAKLPFKEMFKKVAEASASKGASLVTSSSWSSPIINSSPIPMNVFVSKTENRNFEGQTSMKDLQNEESQKIYAPYIQPRPGGPGHVIAQKGKR